MMLQGMFPDLNRLDDPNERTRIYGESSRKLLGRPMYWVILLATAIGMALALFVVVQLVRPYVRLPKAVIGGLTGGIIGGSITGIVQIFFRRPLQLEIRKRLVEKGIPICISCGYDLRGQIEPRCPECGKPSN